ncbi:right-handed parallel beta-helix repeat-containing protein [Arthrobacter sp. UYP6]|uniref:right-handed parallel beta-helix repeat-containing protein n=1 Tax=Arthrobacter sp. UYP6 TaxID=1756378 RepID=UPI0033919354
MAADPTDYVSESPLLRDTMSRTSEAGWGKSENGVPYSTSWLPALAVSGGTGKVVIPKAGSSRTIEAAITPVADTAASYSAAVSALPTSGGGIHSGLQVRHTAGSFYQGTIRLLPGGKAALDISRTNAGKTKTALGASFALPFTVKAKQQVNLEVQATGSSPVAIRARAWPAGTPVPGWQQQAVDNSGAKLTAAGTVRITTYVSGSSQPAAVEYDNLTADELKAGTAPVPPVPAPTPPAPPVPAPVPPVVPPEAPPVPVVPAGGRGKAGSAAVGSTSYPVPAGALFVAGNGSDSAAGTQNAPLRTIAAATSKAAAGTVIVVRGGSYHEQVTIPVNKRLTIQAYPKEAVWLEGSRVVDNFTAAGKVFVAANWTPQFDASSTYSWGKPGTEHGGSFVDPANPMASHPDQVWINDTAQKQVGSLAKVTTGMFYVDYAAKKLYLGTNPAGKTVRASALAKALSIRAENSVVKGIGIRRYAPSVPHMATVTVEKKGVSLENVAITDTSTTGLAVGNTDVTLTNITSTRNGLLGVTAVYADRLKVTKLDASSNNLERFKTAPVAGGMKIGRTRTVTIQQSNFRDNMATGLWLDESVYDATLASNDMVGNASHGVSAEISAKVQLVDNIIANNKNFGVKINNTSEVNIWNNTFSGNGRQINVVQDLRRASNQSTPGHDPRQAFPDKSMTWINGPVTIRNNIISGTTAAGNCMLCVEDYSREFTAEQLKVSAQGNVYHRTTTAAPTWGVIWSRGNANPHVYTSIAAFRDATGQEETHLELAGTSPVNTSTFAANSAVRDSAGTIAVPLPDSIAKLARQSGGARHLGAFTN